MGDILIGLIYDAATDASKWPTFLEALAFAIGATRVTLLIRDTDRTEFVALFRHGWSDDDIRIHAEQFLAIDPWVKGSRENPEGEVNRDFDICPRDEMEASRAFQEFYAPRDAVHGIGGTILVTGTGQSIFAAVRGAASGPFGEWECAILRPLMPHLKRAALIHGEVGRLRRQLATFTAHLDQTPHGLLLTDLECRLLYANAAAMAVTSQQDGLRIEQGRLRIGSARAAAAFAESLHAVGTGRDAPLRRLEVLRPSRKTPFRLLLMPVKNSNVTPLGVSVPAVSVLVIDADSSAEPDRDMLREVYGLTSTEARVTAKLVTGRNVDEISGDLNISVATVRTHVKRILSKTGTDRQAELISLIVRSVPFR